MSQWLADDLGDGDSFVSKHCAAVAEQFTGEPAMESFQSLARNVEGPQPFVFGSPPE